tara:strand:+ start:10 stop:2442 length:2433 start_codon:yes stop_codon:yes gene_type:complete
MANIRKTFNFREGVKVDDSVLVVTGQRVGIGTTIPTKALDIRGNTVISGLVASSMMDVTGIATFGEVKIGTAVTISSGVITATSFSGDGANLSNLPTSQWQDMDVGLGFTSIYNSGNVGVGTTDPRHTFQVGANPDSGGKGVGINSVTGDIKSSGIISATTFSGSFTGDSTGLTGTPNISVGIVSATAIKIGTGITISSGVVSATSFSGDGSGLTGLSAGSVIQTGNTKVSALTGNVVVEALGDVVGTFTTEGLNVGGDVILNGGAFIGNLTGTASVATVALGLQEGASYVTDNLVAGIGSFGSIGIGTTSPVSDIQIVNTTAPTITLGKTSDATDNAGVLRFGSTNSSFPYSNENSLEIINYDTGNVNFYLEAGTVGLNTGDFHWHRRKNFSRLMTLTYGGRLGVGQTQPTHNLHVVGTSTVTGNADFGNDVQVYGDLTVTNGFSASSLTISQITATLTGNVNATSGISTFNRVVGNSDAQFNTLGIGVSADNTTTQALVVNNTPELRVYVDNEGFIGIATDSVASNPEDSRIDAHLVGGIIGAIGVGVTNNIRCAVDFGNAGSVGVVTTNRFMIPPTVTTAERNSITTLQDGALIYNSTNDRLEVYPNSTKGWVGVSTGGSGGGGATALNDLTDVNAPSPTNGYSLVWNNATSQWIPVDVSGTTGYWSNVQTNAGIHTTASHIGLGTDDPQTLVQIKDRYGFDCGNGSWTASAGVAETLDSYNTSTTDFKTAEYTLYITNGSNIHSQKVLVMHNGTTAYAVEYGVMYNPNQIVSMSAEMTGTTVSLKATPETGISGATTYRFSRQTLL